MHHCEQVKRNREFTMILHFMKLEFFGVLNAANENAIIYTYMYVRVCIINFYMYKLEYANAADEECFHLELPAKALCLYEYSDLIYLSQDFILLLLPGSL
uniref:Uncharacterized protein n=1 Tax=Ceratitis capitata TaxID=7213 RepID=W8C5N7_CERCA